MKKTIRQSYWRIKTSKVPIWKQNNDDERIDKDIKELEDAGYNKDFSSRMADRWEVRRQVERGKVAARKIRGEN